MSDETITYSGGEWPSVAIGMPEVQAHVMSYPQAQDDQIRQIQDDITRSIEMVCGVQERKHVSDSAMRRYVDVWGGKPEHIEIDYARFGLVLLTVEEYDELLQRVLLEDHMRVVKECRQNAWKVAEDAQAEVQRLSSELAHRTEVWEGEEFKLRGELSDARAEVERLFVTVTGMTGQADGYREVIRELCERLRKEREDESGGKKCPVVRASIGRDLLNARLNSVVADPLDHRLGLPQPDGDPVAPMSAKKPYRWGWQG